MFQLGGRRFELRNRIIQQMEEKPIVLKQDQPSTSGLEQKRKNDGVLLVQAQKAKLASSSSDESEGSDAECLFCSGRFFEDKHCEQWAKCVHCGRWAHEDTNFICSFCEEKRFLSSIPN
ncbi:unnamed protein product [Psylliodes chrysocephalus]|uniref:Uncharacterized protein n=1 Tax=Psylliodes chrysocephalus TaxID=3402493 RepID=A0A9P0G6R1_9CUCU|nr:unnamed protein product [Psylliodes chrysocephala]